ncbi:hypothetical protein [Streptomyces sp. SID4982]|uniref:hypothetical protein n=1 Tax=Streptomyces sp. SID4982 TaxID=2690291 RepID=UPI0013696DA3|nr:hypothetical protein [Streptomyces sp. SID4982]
MSATAVRRSVLAASVAALALLATACGGSGDADKGAEGKGDGAPAAASAPALKALTAAELEKAGLAQPDVKTGKVTTRLPGGDDIAADKVTTDDAACLPLARAQAGVAQGGPAATAKRSWLGTPKKPAAGTKPEDALLAALDVDKTLIGLASYDGDAAPAAVKGLTEAARKCAGGFTATIAGEKTRFLKAATAAAPQGGDEGVAVNLTMAADEGVKAMSKVVVVRQGATVATFSTINMAAMASGKDYEVPADVIAAQVAKLG